MSVRPTRDFVVRVPEGEFRVEPGGLFVGVVFGADLQGPADPLERFALAAAVPRVSFCTRRRTSSTMADPSFTREMPAAPLRSLASGAE